MEGVFDGSRVVKWTSIRPCECVSVCVVVVVVEDISPNDGGHSTTAVGPRGWLFGSTNLQRFGASCLGWPDSEAANREKLGTQVYLRPKGNRSTNIQRGWCGRKGRSMGDATDCSSFAGFGNTTWKLVSSASGIKEHLKHGKGRCRGDSCKHAETQMESSPGLSRPWRGLGSFL